MDNNTEKICKISTVIINVIILLLGLWAFSTIIPGLPFWKFICVYIFVGVQLSCLDMITETIFDSNEKEEKEKTEDSEKKF